MSIILEKITKHFGNQWVVDQVSLEVADKELFVLLGSSGSGKSTILRMIAGLAEPSSGRIVLHGRDVTYLSPQQRGTGFVFQNYSIFRHMTVAKNIEFGLKIRKIPRAKRAQKTSELLDLVGLAGLGSRYAHQLSGGQQQRVALARALAYEPDVLLLDEPFGALDVKIRAQLRRSLKEIQQRLGVTTILVTHDQEEAFELADRIGVLERGRLLEVGAGENLYARPRSLFAATFLGASNIIVGRVEQGLARFGSLILPIPDDTPHEEGERVQVLFRPEQVMVSADALPPDVPVVGKGEIIEQHFSGALRRLRLKLSPLSNTRQISPQPPFGEENLLIDAALTSEEKLNGEQLWVGLRGWTILEQPHPHLLVCDSGEGTLAPLTLTKSLADTLGAPTTVLAVAENQKASEAMRHKLTERQQNTGLTEATPSFRYGNVAEQIAAEQAESLYDFLVMTSSGKAPRLAVRKSIPQLVGKTLLSVLSQADIPVLIVKGERKEVKRLLICTAAGEPGKSDIWVGGRLARRLNAEATLFFVAIESDEVDTLTRRHLDRGAATLRSLGVNYQVHVREAQTPIEGIVAEMKAGDYDLIVIGSQSNGLRSLLKYNKVMLQVVVEADRPVMVVPTDKV